MTTGFDEFANRIRLLAEQEKECDSLFEEIKKGKGEESVRYLTLRDSCKELRKEIVRKALAAGLTRDAINKQMIEAKKQHPVNRN
jgi:hypothetical protein